MTTNRLLWVLAAVSLVLAVTLLVTGVWPYFLMGLWTARYVVLLGCVLAFIVPMVLWFRGREK